jgi:hypothetical protein
MNEAPLLLGWQSYCYDDKTFGCGHFISSIFNIIITLIYIIFEIIFIIKEDGDENIK